MRRATLIATVASLALAASASADTYWAHNGTAIPAEETVIAPTHGTLKLTIRRPKQTSIKLACATTGSEAFWNGVTNGEDETQSIAFACTGECGASTVTPVLPWGSVLGFSTTWPLPDPWSNMALGITCGSADYGAFTGTLTPGSGDGDEQNGHDEPDSFVAFRTDAGRLDGPEGSTLSFVGFYHFGAGGRGGETVTGETRP